MSRYISLSFAYFSKIKMSYPVKEASSQKKRDMKASPFRDKVTPASNKNKAVKRKCVKTELEPLEDEDWNPPDKKMKTEINLNNEPVGRKKTVTKVKIEKEKKTTNCSSKTDERCVSWNVEHVISGSLDVSVWAAKNVVKLLDEGCTIPFIARYRKEVTGLMEVQKLRDTCSMLEELRYVVHL